MEPVCKLIVVDGSSRSRTSICFGFLVAAVSVSSSTALEDNYSFGVANRRRLEYRTLGP